MWKSTSAGEEEPEWSPHGEWRGLGRRTGRWLKAAATFCELSSTQAFGGWYIYHLSAILNSNN